MRLSTKGRYAVMAMTDLARHGADRAVSLAEIASRQEISLSYLEQLFARLRRGGLVKSARGPGGGYRLAKPAYETSVAEIVLAVDEPIRATRCAARVRPKGCMVGGERCITHHLGKSWASRSTCSWPGVSLADVSEQRVGARRRPRLGGGMSVYLDYNATAPVRPDAAQAVVLAMTASATLPPPMRPPDGARETAETAREAVAALVGARLSM
jgi:Rrf2 family iron-sulfur cluster assembly transcriptional regulator